MREILLAKFNQNADIKAKLVATGNNRLVEATRDAHWGAGAPIHSEEISRGSWNGNNRLGLCLEEVRKQLRGPYEITHT